MMKKEERKRSAAVYVDHSLRPREELDEEISLNIRNARALSIPLYIIRLGEGSVSLLAKEKDIGIEAAARTLRYEALERFRSENGYDFILTAHHLDDQSETLLMRMLSSSPFGSMLPTAAMQSVCFKVHIIISSARCNLPYFFLTGAGMSFCLT